MAKDAYSFLIPVLSMAILFLVFDFKWPALLFAVLGIFVAFFFRDPERVIPGEESSIVSPADGKIVDILAAADGTTRISIFLSIFDVHVNRAPISGRVESVSYLPGRFKAAFDSSASIENEQNVLVIDGGSYRIKFSQIAGILARRIVCWKKPGDSVSKGERIGLIKFGSRVDTFLPQDVRLAVKLGDKVRGGSSVIGRLKDD
jgi:phosphatidylserine decarboxylase